MKKAAKKRAKKAAKKAAKVDMKKNDYDVYYDYLAKNVIAPFYNARFNKLTELKLKKVVKAKNPYLFKAKNIETAGDFVKSILDAYLSSSEETVFGNLLEGFAVFVSGHLYGGFKRPKETQMGSVDLEFERDGNYYIVGIKSGINWGNQDQKDRMKENFKRARIKLRAQWITVPIVAVNGCIYGKDNNPLKDDPDPDLVYYKLCGQDFWEFISGDPALYQEIIKPIDEEAKKKDERFKEAYNAKINEMTRDFIEEFITDNQIDWIKLVDFVSKSNGQKNLF